MAEETKSPKLPTEGGVYVDETGGSDATGNGTIDAPFQTTVAALTASGVQSAVLFRKTPNESYEPLGTSALKKAKKTVELNEKKAQKAGEQKAKLDKEDADRKAKEAKRLEESKNVVLTEDASLPKATKVTPIAFQVIEI